MSYPYERQENAALPQGPKTNSKALIGLVLGAVAWGSCLGAWAINFLSLGVCGICTWPLSILGPVLVLVGLILSGVGYSEVNQHPAGYSTSSKSLASIGLALNGLGLALTVCGFLALMGLLLAGVSIPFLEAFSEGFQGMQ